MDTSKSKKTKKCPPHKPLYNPVTNRCIMDNNKNRKLIEKLTRKSREKSQEKSHDKELQELKDKYNSLVSRLKHLQEKREISKKQLEIYQQKMLKQQDYNNEIEQIEKEIAELNIKIDELKRKQNQKKEQKEEQENQDKLKQTIIKTKKKCPDDKPLLNLKTGRCLKDTPENRVKVGMMSIASQEGTLKEFRRRIIKTERKRKQMLLKRDGTNINEDKTIGWIPYIYKKLVNDKEERYKLDFIEHTLIDDAKIVNKWRGRMGYILIGLLYLIIKHRNVCTIMSDFSSIGDHYQKIGFIWKVKNKKPAGQIDATRTINNVKYYATLYLPLVGTSIYDKIAKCKEAGKRFAVIMLYIGGVSGAHENSMIYDIQKNELEFFEPHGTINVEPETDDYMRADLYEKIRDIFFVRFGTKKMYFPNDICPIGPQVYDSKYKNTYKNQQVINKPGGYCAAWSLYYLDARLTNPDIPRENLIPMFNKKFKKESIYFITNYSAFFLELFFDVFKEYKPLFVNLSKHKAVSLKETKMLNGIVIEKIKEVLAMNDEELYNLSTSISISISKKSKPVTISSSSSYKSSTSNP